MALVAGAKSLWRLVTRRPSVSAIHFEKARPRALREFQELATGTVRFAVWALIWSLGGGAVGLALAWGHGRLATILITTGAATAGAACAFGIPFIWLLVTASTVQRDEARSQIESDANESAAHLRDEREKHLKTEERLRDQLLEQVKQERAAFDETWHDRERIRGLLGESEIRVADLEAKLESQQKNMQAFLQQSARIRGQFGSNVSKPPAELLAARRVRTELKDALRKASTYSEAAARLPAGQGLHYENGFRFETSAWTELGAVLAAFQEYETVELAYTEIGRANDVIGWRATRAKGLYGVSKEDDLPAVIAATDAAIKALDDLILEGGFMKTPYEHLAAAWREGAELSKEKPSADLDDAVTKWTKTVRVQLKKDFPEHVNDFGGDSGGRPLFTAFDPNDSGMYWRGQDATAYMKSKLAALEQIMKSVRQ